MEFAGILISKDVTWLCWQSGFGGLSMRTQLFGVSSLLLSIIPLILSKSTPNPQLSLNHL